VFRYYQTKCILPPLFFFLVFFPNSSTSLLNFSIQKLLRDNHFVSKHCDPPDDCQWLLSQLLDCLSFPSWTKVSEEVQIEMTKVFIYSLAVFSNSFKC
jgi:hypothetical protein